MLTLRIVSRFVPPAHCQQHLAVHWWGRRLRYWTIPARARAEGAMSDRRPLPYHGGRAAPREASCRAKPPATRHLPSCDGDMRDYRDVGGLVYPLSTHDSRPEVAHGV